MQLLSWAGRIARAPINRNSFTFEFLRFYANALKT